MEGMADVDDIDRSWDALIDVYPNIPGRLVGSRNVTVSGVCGGKITCTVVNGSKIGAYIYHNRDGSKALYLADRLQSHLEV